MVFAKLMQFVGVIGFIYHAVFGDPNDGVLWLLVAVWFRLDEMDDRI